MPAAPHHLPWREVESRRRRTRKALARSLPSAGGLLVFSRLNIYYLTGTFASGVLWLPLDADPVLLCRRGVDRARLESPRTRSASFRSFRELRPLLSEFGTPLTASVAAEMKGISWSVAQLLQRHLAGVTFHPGDGILSQVRSVKSPFERSVLRRAGSRHAACLESLLPPLISPGMTEEQIAHRIWATCLGQGHQGLLRMESQGEEVFLGHVAAGESANYPSVFNGPVGLRGTHPASPFMGSPEVRWQEGEPLVIDIGFALEGYHTDRTQVYWGGRRELIPVTVLRAYEFCRRLQGILAEDLLPGARPADLAARAFALARKEGWSEGFMALGGNRVAFVGHGIGLAIDEFPVIAEGFEDPLEEGMFIALEPKIGLPGTGMVGVENTFEVTGRGGDCITGHRFDIICIPSP